MSLRINTNIAALNAHNNLAITDAKLSQNMARLSSGLRINSASDDAAGLSISNKLDTNVRSLTVASQNVSEAKSMVGIAEGSADQVESIIERMKELATEAASSNVGTADIGKIQNEFGTLQQEITRIVGDTNYQGTALLTGTFGNTLDTTTTTAYGTTGIDATGINFGGAGTGTFTIAQALGVITITGPGGVSQTITSAADGVQTLDFSALGISLTTNGSWVATNATLNGKLIVTAGGTAQYQVGSGNTANDSIQVSLGNLQLANLGINGTTNLSNASLGSQTSAQSALDTIDSALNDVNNVLGSIGATVNRLDYTYNNLQTTITNFSASESAIKDVDMASEMTSFTKNQILEQAGTAMLAQANSTSQSILTLFK